MLKRGFSIIINYFAMKILGVNVRRSMLYKMSVLSQGSLTFLYKSSLLGPRQMSGVGPLMAEKDKLGTVVD